MHSGYKANPKAGGILHDESAFITKSFGIFDILRIHIIGTAIRHVFHNTNRFIENQNGVIPLDQVLFIVQGMILFPLKHRYRRILVNDSGHTDEFLIAFVYMAFLFPIAFVIDDFMAPTPELLQIIGKCTYHFAGFITVQRINAANILSLVGIPPT